jgi:hypothetical protein
MTSHAEQRPCQLFQASLPQIKDKTVQCGQAGRRMLRVPGARCAGVVRDPALCPRQAAPASSSSVTGPANAFAEPAMLAC